MLFCSLKNKLHATSITVLLEFTPLPITLVMSWNSWFINVFIFASLVPLTESATVPASSDRLISSLVPAFQQFIAGRKANRCNIRGQDVARVTSAWRCPVCTKRDGTRVHLTPVTGPAFSVSFLVTDWLNVWINRQQPPVNRFLHSQLKNKCTMALSPIGQLNRSVKTCVDDMFHWLVSWTGQLRCVLMTCFTVALS